MSQSSDHKILQDLVALNADTSQEVLILHSLITMTKPKRILELGVRLGVSTRALLVACRAIGSHLISVDTDPCDHAKTVIKDLGLSGNWTFLQLDDRKLLDGWKNMKVGLIFLDTDHDLTHTLEELEICHKLLNPKGILLVHDTLAPNYPDIMKAVHAFLESHKKRYVFHELGTRYGLGMLIKN